MNPSLIAIIGVFMGIISAYIFGYFKNNYSAGLLGNAIIGVFGSVFFTKLIGRFGVNPFKIFKNNYFNWYLFGIYVITAIFGAIFFQILIKNIISKFNKPN